MIDVLVVGSGGREHALVWKINQSPLVNKIYAAPGNGGIASLAECVDISADDIAGLLKFAKKNNIGLTVVGPEVPLVAGIVDQFDKAGLKIFGPCKEAAQLEGSKVFAKEFMTRWAIPTAAYETFSKLNEALTYLEETTFPLVIKADGLAAGKGVFICQDKAQAEAALTQIMDDKIFQDAGKNVLIEECLEGQEASIFAISDGRKFIMLETSQDHKRINDNDEGPNTGGMGAYSPAPIVTEAMFDRIVREVIEPTIKGMNNEGTTFKGVLYAGIMLTKQGPYVLEYNVRFGDPEAQAVLPRLKNDLVEIMLATLEETLEFIEVESDTRPCVSVVMAAGGYPGQYDKGNTITGIDKVSEDAFVFHAGTLVQSSNVVTAGGRVLAVSSLGASIADAIDHVYEEVEKISFKDCHYRRDIGKKALMKVKL